MRSVLLTSACQWYSRSLFRTHMRSQQFRQPHAFHHTAHNPGSHNPMIGASQQPLVSIQEPVDVTAEHCSSDDQAHVEHGFLIRLLHCPWNPPCTAAPRRSQPSAFAKITPSLPRPRALLGARHPRLLSARQLAATLPLSNSWLQGLKGRHSGNVQDDLQLAADQSAFRCRCDCHCLGFLGARVDSTTGCGGHVGLHHQAFAPGRHAHQALPAGRLLSEAACSAGLIGFSRPDRVW